MTLKRTLLCTLCSILTCIVCLHIVNFNCNRRVEIESRIDKRPQDIIEYEHTESAKLTALVEEMYKEIEQENLFEQAYLNHIHDVNENDVKALGNVIYNEARGSSKLEQSCVAWTVLNRCDNSNKSIEEIVSAPYQFAYNPNLKLKSDQAKALLAACEDIARDVIIRHMCEQDGLEYVGRTLPNNYYSFWGDGNENHFRTNVGVQEYWDYSLGNPYI